MEQYAGVSFYSAADILAHPQFPTARAGYVDAVMALYESKPNTIELMLDASRILVFGVTMCLWGAYCEDLRDTWPTVSRLKSVVALFRIASPRQIDHILARLVQTGYVTIAPAVSDGRLRLVLPTPQMIAHDQDWLRAH